MLARSGLATDWGDTSMPAELVLVIASLAKSYTEPL